MCRPSTFPANVSVPPPECRFQEGHKQMNAEVYLLQSLLKTSHSRELCVCACKLAMTYKHGVHWRHQQEEQAKQPLLITLFPSLNQFHAPSTFRNYLFSTAFWFYAPFPPLLINRLYGHCTFRAIHSALTIKQENTMDNEGKTGNNSPTEVPPSKCNVCLRHSLIERNSLWAREKQIH